MLALRFWVRVLAGLTALFAAALGTVGGGGGGGGEGGGGQPLLGVSASQGNRTLYRGRADEKMGIQDGRLRRCGGRQLRDGQEP